MSLTRVDHIDLRVPDLPATERFFEALGFEVIRRTPAPRQSVEVALPGEGQVTFEIREADVSATAVDHIAFRVDDSESAIGDLKSRGISFQTEKHEVAATGRTVSNFLDPSGSRWQLAD